MEERDKTPDLPPSLAEIARQRNVEVMRANSERFRDGRLSTESNGPVTDAEKEYVQSLDKVQKASFDLTVEGILTPYMESMVLRRFIPYQMDVDVAKKLLWLIIKTQLVNKGKELAIDGNSKEVLHDLCLYFIGQEGNLNLKKGIYLFGDVGRGKTFIMECFEKFCSSIEDRFERVARKFTPRSFKSVHANKVVEAYKKKGLDAYGGNLLIDDLGDDKKNGDTIKVWGNEVDPLGDLLTERYIAFNKSGIITHATSNLTHDEWKKAYGTRVESRMFDMFNIVCLKGEDKRLI